MSNDLHVVITYGQVKVSIVHEGCAGNPDVTLDSVMRVGQLFREACEVADEYAEADECDCDATESDDESPDDPEVTV